MSEKIDMHVHSDKSSDGLASISELMAAAKKAGLAGIAICDHNYIHKEKVKPKDLLLIYGVEVSTDRGHVALFGVDSIPTRNAEKLCEWAKAENGVVVPTHPFSLHKKGLGKRAVELGTCVEKFNGTDPINNIISSFMIKNGTGGSDAHHPAEIGLAWTEFEDVSDEDELLEALRKGRFQGKVSHNPLKLPIAFSRRVLSRIGRGKALIPKI
jgi:predicted metal-dependent phosphoesterase TrpH